MAINFSNLLTQIKVDLGIYGLALPFDNPDQEMTELIKSRTLVSFSNFFPDVQHVSLDLKDLQLIKGLYQESIYVIPAIFGKRELLGIRKVYPRSLLISSGYYAPYIDSSPDLYEAMMMTQANSDLMSSIAPPFTFKFQAPNLMFLYNISTLYGVVDIDFHITHSENLSTIKTTSYDAFYDLAILDVKNFLYGALKHFKNIQTAYGTITLEIDDWANAATDRKDMIEKWRDVYHMDQEQFYVI
jgi:hypothetical protein